MIDQAFVSNLFAWSFQVALLTAVAAIVLPVFRVEAPSIRYAWWRAVLALALLLPLVQPWAVPQASAPESLAVPMLPEPAASVVGSVPLGAASVPSARRIPWLTVFGVALVAGALVRLAWLGAGISRLRRLRNAGRLAAPCDGHDELSRLIETGAEIRYVSGGQPVTFGLRRPVVLLPDSLRSMPEGVQRAVLAHELWHVRRRDWCWILAEESIRAILWFHPAIWFVVGRVQAAREEVVDELTILLTNSRRGYLEALLAFADEPPLFAAAPFARRRHLFKRMLIISREAVMSSRRMVVTGAAMLVVMVVTAWAGVSAFPLVAQPEPQKQLEQQTVPEGQTQPELQDLSPIAPEKRARAPRQTPPRDARPGQPRPAGDRESQLKKAIAAGPQASVVLYFELSRLQEDRAALAEAEETLQAGRRAFPGHDGITKQLATFYTRHNNFDKAVAMYEDIAAADPSNPAAHHAVALFYEEKIRKDHALNPAERGAYIQAGIAAADRALTYKPDYGDALVSKNILLRYQAAIEADTGRKGQLIAEADNLRDRALELNKARAAAEAGKARVLLADEPGAAGAVRIGGNIKPPMKVRDVRPVYPPLAQAANVQGVVILEVLIDPSGRVSRARVLRSIPLLDQAALDAVEQWEYTPTLLNGVATPVIMTVTVNFVRQ